MSRFYWVCKTAENRGKTKLSCSYKTAKRHPRFATIHESILFHSCGRKLDRRHVTETFYIHIYIHARVLHRKLLI